MGMTGRIFFGIVGFAILGFFYYVRVKRAIAYYKRDRKADIQTLFDGEK